ncbi:MAG: response regulator [Deltaproteobacteria bacterium]|nr:response regulator [Deltaproteobacteria bacterium]
MTGARDIDRVLLLGLGERVAMLRRLLTRGDEASDPYVVEVMRASIEAIADAHSALAAGAGQVRQIDLVQMLRRALRLVEPRLSETSTQVVFETQPEALEGWGSSGQMLRMLASLLCEACEAPGLESDAERLRTLKLSLGSTHGPWLWISGESLSGESEAGLGELSRETLDLVASVRGRYEWMPLRKEGQRALRVHLPAAAPAPEVTPALAGASASPATPVPAPVPVLPEPVARPAPLGMPHGKPTLPAPVDPQAIVGRAHAVAAAAMEAFVAADAETRRVLVVDDEEALLALFAAILPTIGVEFELAPSAEAALAMMTPGRFSLVIVDKNLPGMSGLEFLRKLSEIDPRVGAVLVTGYASAHAISEALALGVYDFLDKPFPDLPVLLSRLEMALRRHATHARVVRLASELSEIAAVLPAVSGKLDARVARIVRLIAPSDPEEDPLRLLVLAPAQLVASLRARELAGLLVEVAGDAGGVQARLVDPARRPDLVLVDLRLWTDSLTSLVALAKSSGQAVHVVAVTDNDALAPALDALNAGVADYLLAKDAEPELVASRLASVLRRLRLHRRDRALVLELLGVDIDTLVASTSALPAADDLASFEPKLGGEGP